MGKVSVCVPVYNGETHLAACLRSVAAQQPADLEIVVGDDQSTDQSLAVIAAVQKEFPSHNWRILKHPARLGMAGNWNACVEAASGEWIKVMGQDDILYPECLKNQSGVLAASPDVALCACGCEICSASGGKVFQRKRKRKGGVYEGNELIAACLRSAANLIGEPVTTMFRKSDFTRTGGFDLSMRYYIDLDMWMKLLRDRKFAFIEAPYCGFRVHRGGASFSLQGEGYSEFLRLEKNLAFGSPLPAPVRTLRRTLAFRDSMLRLAAYRIFGAI